MQAEMELRIYQAIEKESGVSLEGYLYPFDLGEVEYIIHETGTSVYYGDIHIGEYQTETEAVWEVRKLAGYYR